LLDELERRLAAGHEGVDDSTRSTLHDLVGRGAERMEAENRTGPEDVHTAVRNLDEILAETVRVSGDRDSVDDDSDVAFATFEPEVVTRVTARGGWWPFT
jgi:hypothetical protein